MYLLLLLLLPLSVLGQDGYEIKVKIANATEKRYVLGYYFGSKQQVTLDTAQLGENGFWVFKGKEKMQEGQYLISSEKRAFDLIITNEQHFQVETDTTSLIAKMKVTGSKENEVYYTFLQELSKKFFELRANETIYQLRKDGVSYQKMQVTYNSIERYKRDFVKTNESYFCAKIVKATLEPLIPDVFRQGLRGKKDSIQQVYYYYKNHFLEGTDFTDPRLMRTKVLQTTLENYMTNVVVQTPDSLIKEADRLVSLTKNIKDTKKYVIYWLASTYELPKQLGNDAVFVHVASKYYVGEPTLWDSSSVKKIKEKIDVLTPLLNGKVFPQLMVTDTLGREIDIHKINSKYSFLIFYDPACGHCRESAPKIVESYKKLKDKGCNFYMVCVEYNPYAWRGFIQQFKTQILNNVIDIHINPNTKEEEHYVNFKKQFDIYSTPVTYVLDAQKRIIAKRLPVNQFEDFIKFMEQKKQ
jgi:thiol-disulfide isomerase/thioredoxin